MVQYQGRMVSVTDGDTQRCHWEHTQPVMDYLQKTWTPKDRPVRLLGAWCPEKRDPGGPEATAFAIDWYATHDHPHVECDLVLTTEPKVDAFGRLLAIVRCATDNACLNEDLIGAGHATPDKSAVHVESLRVLAREEGPATPAGRLLLRATTGVLP